MPYRMVDDLMAARPAQQANLVHESKKLVGTARLQLDRSKKAVEQMFDAHPLACLGIAVVTGIALGWWIKRT